MCELLELTSDILWRFMVILVFKNWKVFKVLDLSWSHEPISQYNNTQQQQKKYCVVHSTVYLEPSRWMFSLFYREWQNFGFFLCLRGNGLKMDGCWHLQWMECIVQWFKVENIWGVLLFMHSHAAVWSHPHLTSGVGTMFTTMIGGKLFNCGCEGCFHVALAIITLHTLL